MDIVLIAFGWIVATCAIVALTQASSRIGELRAELKDCEVTLESNRATFREMGTVIQNNKSVITELISERDKWQVECAKLRATTERQAGDIVRLETALKTAQRANGVRASNR